MLMEIKVRRRRRPGPAPAGRAPRGRGRYRVQAPGTMFDTIAAVTNPAGWAISQFGNVTLDMMGMGEAPTWFWFPSTIESLKQQVRSDLQSAAAYVAALRKEAGQGIVPDTLLTQFKGFYNEVMNWTASVGFWEKLNGATATRLQNYQVRVREWRALLDGRAKAAGSKTVAPPVPAEPSPGLDDLAKRAGTIARWLMIGGGALLAYKIASDTGVLKTLAPAGKRGG